MRTKGNRPAARVILLLVLLLSVGSLLPVTAQGWLPVVAERATTGNQPAIQRLPYADVNSYGANTFLSKEVEDWKREKTVQMMADAGLGWMKQQFPWSEIEPKPGRFWDDKYNQDSWDKYDRIVSLAEKYGIRVIARLDNTPEWARDAGTNTATPPSNPDTYANFVYAFVKHYKGRVQFIQIWNEPNLRGEWGGKIDSAAYAALLKRAYVRAKEADPNIVVLSAPLAQTLEQGDRGLDETVYLRQLYQAGIAGYFDILFANGYGLDQPPEAPPAPGVLNFRRIELLRGIMEANGDANKAVWLNEYGWNAAPSDFPPNKLTWSRVSEEQQARYTVDGIRYARAHWPWLGVVNIWYFRQVGDIPADQAEYYFRMVDTEFTPRLIYREVLRATAELRLALPGAYGALQAPLVTRGRWLALYDDRSSPSVQSDRVNDQLVVRFRGNRLDLQVVESPQGGRLGVTIDGSTDALGNLPRDDQGRRYVNVRGSSSTLKTISIVDNLDPFGQTREHVAVFTVLSASNGQTSGTVAIAGIRIGDERSTQPALIVLGLAVLSLVAVLGTLGRVVRRPRAVGVHE